MSGDTPLPRSVSPFQWACLAAAILFGLTILWMIYDLKREVQRSLTAAGEATELGKEAMNTVNEQLPEMVVEVKKGTKTLAELSEDVKLIKSVTGVENENQRGLRGLAVYANEVQKFLAEQTEEKQAVILAEELIGSDLKQHSTMEEFLVALNREMVVILPLAKSRQEILWRLAHSGPPRRLPFHLKFPDQEPVKLEDYIRQHHPTSGELPVYEP